MITRDSWVRVARALAWLLLALLLQRAVWLEHLHHPLWVSLALVAGFVLAGVALAGHLLSGAWLGVGAFALLRAVSLVKLSFLQEPLNATDLRDAQWEETVELFTQYWGLGLALLACLLGTLALLVLLHRRPGRWPAAARASAAALALGCGAGVVNATVDVVLADAGPQSSSILSFISTFHDEPPRLQSPLPPSPKVAQLTCPAQAPNVISVLQESTYRPARLESQPWIQPFYRGNAWAGPLHVHVVGGMTHLSEFAYFTGFPHTALKGENSYPQVPLAGRIHGALPRWFKDCGYETTVIYATKPHFRNSLRWYASLGFDHILSAGDLGFAAWHASDRLLYEKALAQLASHRSGKPQFVHIRTVDRHGPYSRSDPHGDFEARLRRGVEDDAWLRQQLAPAAQSGRPWLLAWFGDHRPAGIDDKDATRYTTWAVLDWPGQTRPAAPETGPLDLAFWGDRVMREAGIVVQPLAQRVEQMRQRCAADYHQCAPELRDRHTRDYIDIGGFTEAGPTRRPPSVSGPAPG